MNHCRTSQCLHFMMTSWAWPITAYLDKVCTDVRYNFCVLWLWKSHPHSSILYSKIFVCNAPQTLLFRRTLTASFLTTVLPILTSDNELSLRTLKRIPLLQFVQFHSWSMSGHLGYLPLTLQQLITLPWVDQCLMSQFWCIIYPHLNNYTPAEKTSPKVYKPYLAVKMLPSFSE